MWLTISQPTERPTQRSVPFSLVAAHRQNALIARCRVPTPSHIEHFFAFTHYFESTFFSYFPAEFSLSVCAESQLILSGITNVGV